jgi:E3 ubiquitin-protein ligase HUWE1
MFVYSSVFQISDEIHKEIQTVALYALDGISRHRSKLNTVLNAINASTNHGILMSFLRKLVSDSTGLVIR